MNCVKTNFKQKKVITKAKPSRRLGAVPPDPHIWDQLQGIGTPPEKFLPMSLQLESYCHSAYSSHPANSSAIHSNHPVDDSARFKSTSRQLFSYNQDTQYIVQLESSHPVYSSARVKSPFS